LTHETPVIDFHAHLPVGWTGGRAKKRGRGRRAQDPVAAYAEKRWERMKREWDLPEPDWSLTSDELIARWAAEVDRHGLRCVNFITGGGNDSLAAAVRAHPGRFRGFAHHDPEAPGALDELRRAVEGLGLCGYKIIGPDVRSPLQDERFEPLWRYCEERRLPVLIHFGLLGHAGGIVSGQNISPLAVAGVAAAHPALPLVVPHFGCGYWQELLHLAWACPNVYVDTSGSNQWMRWMPYPLDLESLFRKAYETLGPGRILFGTDSSWFPRGFAARYLQDQLRVCHWLNLPAADIRKMFHDNAAALLGLALAP